MKQLATGWLIAVLAFACTGDDGGGTPTPEPRKFGASCMTASDTSTECDSGVCTDAFDQLPTPVCSQKCTAGDGSTCPEGSEGKKCNMRGYCKP